MLLRFRPLLCGFSYGPVSFKRLIVVFTAHRGHFIFCAILHYVAPHVGNQIIFALANCLLFFPAFHSFKLFQNQHYL